MNFQKKGNKILAAFLPAIIFFAACQTKRENSGDFPANQLEIPVSAEGANAAEPSVAADANGNVYVLYVEHYADKTADVFLQKFDADGKLTGEKTRVNLEKGQAKAWYGDAPTIKISGDNKIFVGWTARAEKPGATVLYLSVSGDGGKTFDAPVKVNDDTAPASHGMHSLAIGKDGRVFMAWLDERNIKTKVTVFDEKSELPEGFQIVKAHHNSNSNQEKKPEKKETKTEAAEPNSEVFFAVSTDGGKTFSANKKLSSEVCPCCKTFVTVAPDGKTYVSWRQVLEGDFRHIAVAASADGGESFEKPVIVSDDQWEINACPISGAAMAVDSAGFLKVIWYTAGRAGKPGLYYSESKDGGKTFSPRSLLNSETITGTSVILSEAGEKSRFVFSDATNQIIVGSATNGASNFNVGETIRNAQLPSAALVGEKLLVAFVRKETEDKQSVWIYRQIKREAN